MHLSFQWKSHSLLSQPKTLWGLQVFACKDLERSHWKTTLEEVLLLYLRLSPSSSQLSLMSKMSEHLPSMEYSGDLNRGCSKAVTLRKSRFRQYRAETIWQHMGGNPHWSLLCVKQNDRIKKSSLKFADSKNSMKPKVWKPSNLTHLSSTWKMTPFGGYQSWFEPKTASVIDHGDATTYQLPLHVGKAIDNQELRRKNDSAKDPLTKSEWMEDRMERVFYAESAHLRICWLKLWARSLPDRAACHAFKSWKTSTACRNLERSTMATQHPIRLIASHNYKPFGTNRMRRLHPIKTWTVHNLGLVIKSKILCYEQEADISPKIQLAPVTCSYLFEQNFLKADGRTQIRRQAQMVLYVGKTVWKSKGKPVGSGKHSDDSSNSMFRRTWSSTYVSTILSCFLSNERSCDSINEMRCRGRYFVCRKNSFFNLSLKNKTVARFS